VFFPARDRDGTLTGAQLRVIAEGEPGPSKLTRGSPVVFSTSPEAWSADPLIIVEAPIDALSLAACGSPALAVFGCNLPDCLPRLCAWRRVVIGTDNDAAGDAAAAAWEKLLRPLGAEIIRFRPEHKDFNDWLLADPEGLRAALRERLDAGGPPPSGPSRDELAAHVEAATAAALLFDQCAGGWDDETYERERDRLLREIDTTHAALAAAGRTWQEFESLTGAGGLWHHAGTEPAPVAPDPEGLAALTLLQQHPEIPFLAPEEPELGEVLERRQWKRNADGGQAFGNRMELRRLTRAACDRYLAGKPVPPAATAYVVLQRPDDPAWVFWDLDTGQGWDPQPPPTWCRQVDAFDSPDALTWGLSADSGTAARHHTATAA
jgi:hypothetical protein